MKTLYIIRHAKSRKDLFGVNDFDRPLAERGFQDAITMANRLKDKLVVPDVLISSPALRAITTAKLFAETLDYPEKKIQLELDIYEAFSSDILTILQSIPINYNIVLIFGHNPAFTSIFNYLSGCELVNLPTTGIGKLEFDVKSWSEIEMNTAKTNEVDFPKNV